MFFIIERVKEYLKVLKKTIHTNECDILDIEFSPGREFPKSWDKYNGSSWGGREAWAWFKTNVTIPDHFSGKTVVLKLCTDFENPWNTNNPQFTVYVNGKIAQAFDTNHVILYLSECAKAGEQFEILYQGYPGITDAKMEFKPSLFIHNYKIQRLCYNIEAAMLAAEMYPAENELRLNIENYLTNTLNIIDLRKPMSEEYLKSVDDANTYIEEEFYKKYCAGNGPVVNCIGHTHIDIAWLWTVDQTRQKAVRSFSTALMLMDRYPDFIFTSSQPQLYKFVKEDAPEVYERIKEKIKEGRWEPEGAMWVEADCNLTSGESLIRQILHGKRFFKEEFNKESKILWLPDVFGYSAALPQILRKSGIDTFVTSKISWNEYNAMPYQTFNWKGIDGTEVFTQFLMGAEPCAKLGDKNNHHSTYNGHILPNTLAFSWEHYMQKNINNEILTSYGYGDGGGGVTEEMLEFHQRLSKGIPGTPVSKLTTAVEAIDKIKSNVKGKKLPKWVGELYLEFHRGTYTSMGKNKRFNRVSEFLLQHTETSTLINKILLKGEYPKDMLYSAWECVLLNQFHDIIPGSSIKEVYEVTDAEYTELINNNTIISDMALKQLADNTLNTGIFVYNPTSFERSDVVEYNGKYLYAENIPPFGWKVISEREEPISDLNVSESQMENKFYLINFDNCGNIIRLYDKVNKREVLKQGERGNVLQAFDDHPHQFDNWEISIYYSEKMWEINDVISIEKIENPLFVSLKIIKKFMDSQIEQTITIYRDIPRIDFDNNIDWCEKHILLKAAFPVDVLSDKATYEIQYGALERPTHSNTSWDFAKFEVCAHKWADLSEAGYGVALMNDCKYGYDIHDGVMRLSLLKSGSYPNPDADLGNHKFKYSLMPHEGDWRQGKVVKEAFALNCPLKVFTAKGGGMLSDTYSFISSNCENVVITTVKEACDDEDIIIRIYESFGKRTEVVIKTGFDIEKVYESDFIETLNYSEIENDSNSFSFIMKPYEIKTLRVKAK